MNKRLQPAILIELYRLFLAITEVTAMQKIVPHLKWIFSGIGVALIGWLISLFGPTEETKSQNSVHMNQDGAGNIAIGRDATINIAVPAKGHKGALEVVEIREIGANRFDLIMRNTAQNDSVITAIGVKKIQCQDTQLKVLSPKPVLNPSATYRLDLTSVRDDELATLPVSHLIPANSVDRLNIVLNNSTLCRFGIVFIHDNSKRLTLEVKSARMSND